MNAKVTPRDCAYALDAIEREIDNLKLKRTELDRQIEALRTQGFLINQLVKRL